MLVAIANTLAYVGISIFLIFQTRKYTTQILLLPFVYSMGRAVYIDIYPSHVYYATLTPHDIMFFLLFIAARRITIKRHSFVLFKVNSVFLFPFILMTALVLLEILLSLSQAWYQGQIGLRETLASRIHLFFPVSFFLLVYMMRHIYIAEIFRFLDSIANITIAFLSLYILNSGLGVVVYPYALYFTTYIHSSTIVRDFLTFPYWTSLAISYKLVAPSNIMKYISSLFIFSFGIVLTYTRSFILSFSISIALYLFYLPHVADSHKVRKLFYISIFLLIIITIFFFSPYSKSESSSYLLSRFSGISIDESSINDRNLQSRTNRFDLVYNDVRENYFFFGQGFFSANDRYLPTAQSDGDWPYILHVMGSIGLIIYILPILFTVIGCLGVLYSKAHIVRKQLAMIILLYMVFYISYTLVSQYIYFWNVLAPFGPALAAVNTSNAWLKRD